MFAASMPPMANQAASSGAVAQLESGSGTSLLGWRLPHGARADLVRARYPAGVDGGVELRGAVGGETHQSAGAGESARGRHRLVVLADVHAVGAALLDQP